MAGAWRQDRAAARGAVCAARREAARTRCAVALVVLCAAGVGGAGAGVARAPAQTRSCRRRSSESSPRRTADAARPRCGSRPTPWRRMPTSSSSACGSRTRASTSSIRSASRAPFPPTFSTCRIARAGPGSEVLFSVDNGRTLRPARRADACRRRTAAREARTRRLHPRSLGSARAARCRRHGDRAVSRGAALTLDDVFGADGALAERLPGFTYRAAQQQMAELVVEALESGRHAVIEAGTGIGKTFAYLLPVLLLERRAIISTGTHTLQDQLFGRDLPLLGAVVGRPMRGRRAQRPQQLSVLASARRGARDGTRDAHDGRGAPRARRVGTDERHRRSDRARGPGRRSCVARPGHVDRRQLLGQGMRVRRSLLRRSRRADARKPREVVIVNHHLLLADLALKDLAVRRAAAGNGRRDRRRGAPAARRRAAVLRLVGQHARARVAAARRVCRGARGRRRWRKSMRR